MLDDATLHAATDRYIDGIGDDALSEVLIRQIDALSALDRPAHLGHTIGRLDDALAHDEMGDPVEARRRLRANCRGCCGRACRAWRGMPRCRS